MENFAFVISEVYAFWLYSFDRPVKQLLDLCPKSEFYDN